jgi:hypothetical protein
MGNRPRLQQLSYLTIKDDRCHPVQNAQNLASLDEARGRRAMILLKAPDAYAMIALQGAEIQDRTLGGKPLLWQANLAVLAETAPLLFPSSAGRKTIGFASAGKFIRLVSMALPSTANSKSPNKATAVPVWSLPVMPRQRRFIRSISP